MTDKMKKAMRKFLGMADIQELRSATYDYLKSLERINKVTGEKQKVNGKSRKTKPALLFVK
jgi:hypothetical protein